MQPWSTSVTRHKHMSTVHLYYADGKMPAEGQSVCFGNYAVMGRDWESEIRVTDKDGIAEIPHDRECRATIIVNGKIVRKDIQIPGEFRAQLEEQAGCFPGDTRVLTPTGHKPVRLLEEGDQVLSWDKNSSRITVCRVKTVVRHASVRVWSLGFGKLRAPLRVTRFHTLLTSRGWLRVDQIKNPGAEPRGMAGRMSVIATT